MARRCKKGWQGDVQVNGFGRQRKLFKTEAQARAFERNPIPHLTGVDQRTIGYLFPKLAPQVWQGRADERNVFRIIDELVRRLGPDRLVTDIDNVTVMNLTKELEKEGNKASTVNSKLTRLSKLLKQCLLWSHITAMPVIRLKRGEKNARIRFFTKEEEQALIGALPDHSKQMATFLLYTGCRYSEAQKLRWEDVREQDVTFWDTKSGNPRSVTLTRQAKEALEWCRARYQPLGSQMAPFDIPYESFRNHWAKARKKAKLDKDPYCVPHVLRHTCASRLAMAGVHVTRIQHWMGHETRTMTDRYMHLAPGAMNDVAKALEVA